MPRLTRPLAMIARASEPGTRKSTGRPSMPGTRRRSRRSGTAARMTSITNISPRRAVSRARDGRTATVRRRGRALRVADLHVAVAGQLQVPLLSVAAAAEAGPSACPGPAGPRRERHDEAGPATVDTVGACASPASATPRLPSPRRLGRRPAGSPTLRHGARLRGAPSSRASRLERPDRPDRWPARPRPRVAGVP